MKLAFISLLSLAVSLFLCWSATQTAKQLAKEATVAGQTRFDTIFEAILAKPK